MGKTLNVLVPGMICFLAYKVTKKVESSNDSMTKTP